MNNAARKFLTIATLVWMTGCGGGGTGDVTAFMHALQSDKDAKNFIQTLTSQSKAILQSMPSDPNNTTATHVINGTDGGTATVTGRTNSQDSNCGTDCTSTTVDEDYEISFDNYKNAAGTISSGKISYHHHHYNQQNGLNYSSTESYTIKSLTSVHAKIIEYTYEEEVHGLNDTVDFSGTSSSSLTNFTGTCTNEKGETFSY
jgi:hypothetical protein